MRTALCLAGILAIGCGSGTKTPPGGNTGGAGGTGGNTAGTGGNSAGTGGNTGGAGGGDAGTAFPLSPEHEAKLKMAVETWRQAKPSCASYSYWRGFTSMAAQRSYSTRVQIANDRPVARDYEERGRLPDGGQGVLVEWHETGNEVGRRDGGIPPSTVEELHAECRSALAHDPKSNYLLLEIGDKGVPGFCYYRPNNCADDCAVGIMLGRFQCLTGNPDAL
jgi:hypothetical protein